MARPKGRLTTTLHRATLRLRPSASISRGVNSNMVSLARAVLACRRSTARARAGEAVRREDGGGLLAGAEAVGRAHGRDVAPGDDGQRETGRAWGREEVGSGG